MIKHNNHNNTNNTHTCVYIYIYIYCNTRVYIYIYIYMYTYMCAIIQLRTSLPRSNPLQCRSQFPGQSMPLMVAPWLR